ncbi:MAG: choice-of-anchor J domain-containing protein [Bacteroidota bacterium]
MVSQEKCGAQTPKSGEFENWISRKREIKEKEKQRSNQSLLQNTIYEIPVVVHILHQGELPGEGSNLSTDRILGQIDSLSADFRRLNADRINTPNEFLPVAADTEISFILARQDPNGQPTNGVVRVNASRSFDSFRNSDLIDMRSLSHWPAENYLNIYCADLKTGSLNLIGSAIFPETNEIPGINPEGDQLFLDAVFVDHLFFGNNADAPSFESRGRTLTHEVGHFLGLRHIWGDGGCSVDDFVNDTPLANTDNDGYSSPCTFPNPEDMIVCVEGEPEMFQNYMDYTNDICMNLFTEGQKERMRIVSENSPRRASLRSSAGLTSPNRFADDLALTDIVSPDFATCENQITPILEVTNHGLNEITQYSVTLLIDGVEAFSTSENTRLLPFERETIGFPNQILSGSGVQLSFRIDEVNQSHDSNPTNDLITRTINHLNSIDLPFIQDFENGTELLGNIGGTNAWNIRNAPNESPSNNALAFQSFNNNRSYGDELILTTPPLDLNGVATAVLSFSYAYSGTPQGIYDGLIVKGSSNCGFTYPEELFSQAGNSLYFLTATPTENEFIPSSQIEWKDTTINISEFQNTDGVRFQFMGLNGSNNIYLDNIRIEQSNIFEDDISLQSIRGPLVTCDDDVDIKLQVKNAGSQPITSFTINGFVNEEPFTQSFDNLFIQWQEYQSLGVNVTSLNSTENNIIINVSGVNGRLDQSVISNSIEVTININTEEDDYPLTIDFESSNEWINISPQKNTLWISDTLPDGNISLRASSFEEQTLGIESWFVSPALTTGGLDSAGLYFRLSYAKRSGFNDQFRVLISDDCGSSFNTLPPLLEASSDSLAVTQSSERWQPSTNDDWKEFYLDLSESIHIQDSIRIAFVMINGNGNNLYLDDISIRGNELPSYEDVFRVYPNPAFQIFNLGFNLPIKEVVTIEMIDISGKIILTQTVSNAFNQILQIESPKHSGLYFIRVSSSNFEETQRLLVNSN